MLINEALLSMVVSASLVGIVYGTYVVTIVLLRRWKLRKLTKEIKEYQARQRRHEAQRNNKPWVNYTERRLHNSVR